MLYELRVEIEGIEPHIWRRIQVPARTSLKRLHKILQIAFGWSDAHLHMFRVAGKEYSELIPEFDAAVLDESKITLDKIFAGGPKSFRYEYDMGDSWIHIITFKKQIESEATKAGCTAGARAAPPEDCGGTQGYDDFLVTLSDPKHEDHEEMLEWIGGYFDPNYFDLEYVDQEIKSLR
jgi:hypothetical protein